MSNTEKHGAPSKTITIKVNGQDKHVPETDLTFDDLLSIAAMDPPKGTNEDIAISYTGGPKEQPVGTIVRGMSVKPVENMNFNVTRTDKS